MKPEKDVEKFCLEWARNQGWNVNIYEAKSTWNESLGRYINQSIIPGHPDMAGNTDFGLAAYVELKAPGKRSTIRLAQWEFLVAKIETGCFAVCVDSAQALEIYWNGFKAANNKKQFLLNVLPKKPKEDPKDRDLIFDLD